VWTGRSILTVAIVVAALLAAYWAGAADLGEPSSSAADAPAHGCDDARVLPTEDLGAAEAATLCLLNAERGAAGLPPLSAQLQLRAAALDHSRDMVERRFFDHVNPDGTDAHQRIASTGYRVPSGGASGENIAYGEGARSTPAEIVAGWMASPGHRANILRSRFDEIGIGIEPRTVERSPYDAAGATYTTTFGG
jgi:uncharacterized protein YkwD